jgi:CRP-like cAMP-binding protein
MNQLIQAMRSMIAVTDVELDQFLATCKVKKMKKNEYLTEAGVVPEAVYFINKGLLRMVVIDQEGQEHTNYFALENQFIADYASFILKKPSVQVLQALENAEVVVIPRTAVDWGYANLVEGQKMGRLIAEYYFICLDERTHNNYSQTPKERYDAIADVFPGIHNRVPQHMIASYLGMTPVHLSRLKGQMAKKS